jgi:hypothetical protein
LLLDFQAPFASIPQNGGTHKSLALVEVAPATHLFAGSDIDNIQLPDTPKPKSFITAANVSYQVLADDVNPYRD